MAACSHMHVEMFRCSHGLIGMDFRLTLASADVQYSGAGASHPPSGSSEMSKFMGFEQLQGATSPC